MGNVWSSIPRKLAKWWGREWEALSNSDDDKDEDDKKDNEEDDIIIINGL